MKIKKDFDNIKMHGTTTKITYTFYGISRYTFFNLFKVKRFRSSLIRKSLVIVLPLHDVSKI